MVILSFRLGMSMEVRRRQAGQVREGKLPSPLNRLRRTSEGNAMWLGCWTGGEHVRTSAPPEPLFGICSWARHGSVREVPCLRGQEISWQGREEGLTGVRPYRSRGIRCLPRMAWS
jgi:hypothetical protein